MGRGPTRWLHEYLSTVGCRPNTVKGPRVGRRDKTATSKVVAQPLPQPKPGAKIPQRPARAKTGGKDFLPGQNSHVNGDVFRRTEDQQVVSSYEPTSYVLVVPT